MSKITPFLWIDAPVEEVKNYYKLIFRNEAKLSGATESFDDTPGGRVDVFSITLKDQEFRIMCTRTHGTFSDSVSFELPCKDQAEIDYYWNEFTDEGKESQCGWCRDKYGVRWQVVPGNMSKLVDTPEALQAMLSMKKLIIADLEAAS